MDERISQTQSPAIIRDTIRRMTFRDDPPPPLEQNLEPPRVTPLDRFEARFRPWAYCLAILHLVVTGLILILKVDPDLENNTELFLALYSSIGTLWFFFVLEFAFFSFAAAKNELKLREGLKRRRLLVLLFPPTHICLRHTNHINLCWIPGWGWCRANSSLFTTMKDKLEIPMIGIALLIIPMLVIEWMGMTSMGTHFPGGAGALHITMRFGEAFIWATFALEFLVMVSLARDKVAYSKDSWLDILIILLPLVLFLRSARVLRVARLNQLARANRLKSVGLRMQRAVVVANALSRFINRDPEKRARALIKKSRASYLKYREPEIELLKLLNELNVEDRKRIMAILEKQLAPEELESESPSQAP